MPTMTVRNLPDDVHRRIRLYAAEHGISADAQIAAIAGTHGFAIATRDANPFQRAGLSVINPWKTG